MLAILQLPAFWVGAVVFLLSQWGKFCEFGSISGNNPDARPTLILRLKPRDLTNARTFHGALAAFLIVSFFIYLLLCLLPSGVVGGWIKLETGKALTTPFEEPQLYPLLVASILIGITQPIPAFDRIANFQREVFHSWIGIPEMVQDAAATYSQEILARAQSDALLADEIQNILNAKWIAGIGDFSDIRFFNDHLNRVGLDKTISVADVIGGSIREKKFVIQELVLAACIAGVRKSGGASLPKLAAALGVSNVQEEVPGLASRLGGGLLIVLLCAIVLWPVLPMPMLRDWIQNTFSITNKNFWPQNLYSSGQYIMVNFVPMILSTLIAIVSIRPMDDIDSKEIRSIVQILNRYALTILSIFLLMMVYGYLQALFDIGNSTGTYPYNNLDFIISRIPYFSLQALIPALGAFILTIFLVRPDLRRSSAEKLSWAILLVLVAVAASFFNAIVRAQYQFDAGNQPQLDFILLIVGLNALSAVVTFLLASLVIRQPRST